MNLQGDKASIYWTVAKRRRADRRSRGMGSTATAVASVVTAASQGGTNPVADINAVIQTIESLTSSKDSAAARYHKYDAEALKAVSVYGTDFISGAAALGISVTAVASAMSDYLAEDEIILTPQQLIASQAGTSTGAGLTSLVSQANMPYLLGAGALVLVVLLMGHKS